MINLTTKLKAYPRIEPSILSNYYTKELTQETINQSLEGYVKEVENPADGSIYGRALVNDKMKWVDIFGINPFVAYSISNNPGGPEETDFPTTTDIEKFPRELDSESNIYTIEVTPAQSGYLWLCSNKEITKVEFIASVNAFNTIENIQKIKEIDIEISDVATIKVGKIYCYRTLVKYVALGNKYTFQVTLR